MARKYPLKTEPYGTYEKKPSGLPSWVWAMLDDPDANPDPGGVNRRVPRSYQGGWDCMYENWPSQRPRNTNQQNGKRRRGERIDELFFRAYSDDDSKGGE